MSDKDKSSCFTATIDTSLSGKLRKDLIDQGFEMTEPPYTFFSAKKTGVSCTLYLSGKLTVQGKGKQEFISFYLEPEILKDFSYTYTSQAIDPTPRIGDDESGKGDFFGPLCVAGLYAAGDGVKELIKLGVKDSKQLNDTTIVSISRELKKRYPHKILRLFPEKYNELYEKFNNLNHLLAWCHSAVIENLILETKCSKVILDQFAPASLMIGAMKKKKIELDLTQRPRAEEDPVVAAASILARASFVEGMQILSEKVGIELPKGASSQVIQIGKRLVNKQGENILRLVGKLHFKTKDSILHD
jgi:ribonuclease HIII